MIVSFKNENQFEEMMKYNSTLTESSNYNYLSNKMKELLKRNKDIQMKRKLIIIYLLIIRKRGGNNILCYFGSGFYYSYFIPTTYHYLKRLRP